MTNTGNWSYTEWKKRTNAPTPAQLAHKAIHDEVACNPDLTWHDKTVPVNEFTLNVTRPVINKR